VSLPLTCGGTDEQPLADCQRALEPPPISALSISPSLENARSRRFSMMRLSVNEARRAFDDQASQDVI